MPRIVICKECGKEREYFCKNLCYKCYWREYRHKQGIIPRGKYWGRDRKGNVYHECKKCGTIEFKCKGNGLCIKCHKLHLYHKKYPNAGYKNGIFLTGRWSMNYKRCIKCGTVNIKHHVKGLCEKCYGKNRHFSNKNTCIDCGKSISNKTIKCKSCSHKIRVWSYKYERCIKCGTDKIKHHCNGLCNDCYKKEKRILIICKTCGKEKEHRAFGLCKNCYIYSWQKKNKEKVREAIKRWIKKNPYKLREYSSKKRLKRKNHFFLQGISVGMQIKIFQRDGVCIYCGKNIENIDHIIPINKGGTNEYNNLVSACKFCNSSKHDKDVFEWCKEKGIEIPNIVTELLEKQKEQMRLEV